MHKPGLATLLFILMACFGQASAAEHASTTVDNVKVINLEQHAISNESCFDDMAFIQITGSTDWFYIPLATGGGRAMLATVHTVISTGQSVKFSYLNNDHRLNCGNDSYKPVAFIAVVPQ